MRACTNIKAEETDLKVYRTVIESIESKVSPTDIRPTPKSYLIRLI